MPAVLTAPNLSLPGPILSRVTTAHRWLVVPQEGSPWPWLDSQMSWARSSLDPLASVDLQKEGRTGRGQTRACDQVPAHRVVAMEGCGKKGVPRAPTEINTTMWRCLLARPMGQAVVGEELWAALVCHGSLSASCSLASPAQITVLTTHNSCHCPRGGWPVGCMLESEPIW